MHATWLRYWQAADLYWRLGNTVLEERDGYGRGDFETHGRLARALPAGLLYEADFVFGTLIDHSVQMLDLDYERLYADDDSRLCRQPWQEELKLAWTEHARSIRDGKPTPPPTLAPA